MISESVVEEEVLWRTGGYLAAHVTALKRFGPFYYWNKMDKKELKLQADKAAWLFSLKYKEEDLYWPSEES